MVCAHSGGPQSASSTPGTPSTPGPISPPRSLDCAGGTSLPPSRSSRPSLIVDVSRKNGLHWDCVVSCEMIGSYKPNPEAYITCAKWLGYRPEEILMVACHNFDLLAARKTGYRSAFVRRPDEWGDGRPARSPTPDPAHDIVVDDFGQLADRLGC